MLRGLRTPDPTRRTENYFGPAMVLPALLGLGLFQFYPLVSAVLNSFRTFNAFTKRPTGWAGWNNFIEIFADDVFRNAVLITLIYIVLMIAIVVPMALGLAILIDKRMRGTALARAAILGALASSEAVAALIWNQLYEPGTGLFDAILKSMGLPEQPFLVSGPHAIVSIVVMTAWKDVGLPMLIFLGGLQAISPQLIEAAALDGASSWRIFRRITLPLLRPSLILAIFMVTVAAARLFTPIILLTQGGPDGQTTNVPFYSYAQAFEFSSPGTASASVMFMMVILVGITALQAFVIRDSNDGGRR
ncbi:sugar ABC transporter permease [Alsobacter sp. SYSU M60028]|uniref:Sugar ABC transporter permease n=1 Tax=Alsobacter ponti TaxID=2962936 RepID=A0ABT1L8R3_9HYPH|nr:sugar ABC transporter permease [Alsobacter ponti]MCP8937423.1 sugar ABC transporter permease [Alsobacter ponti]